MTGIFYVPRVGEVVVLPKLLRILAELVPARHRAVDVICLTVLAAGNVEATYDSDGDTVSRRSGGERGAFELTVAYLERAAGGRAW